MVSPGDVTITLPLAGPTALGAKVTTKVHDVWAASARLLHWSAVIRNAGPLELLTSSMDADELPVLFTVKVTLPLLPTSTTLNGASVGCRVNPVEEPRPEPVRVMSVRLPDPATTDSVADAVPSELGEKTTETVQTSLGARVLPEQVSVLTANDEFGGGAFTVRAGAAALPTLRMVVVCGALVLLRNTLPNGSDEGSLTMVAIPVPPPAPPPVPPLARSGAAS